MPEIGICPKVGFCLEFEWWKAKAALLDLEPDSLFLITLDMPLNEGVMRMFLVEGFARLF